MSWWSAEEWWAKDRSRGDEVPTDEQGGSGPWERGGWDWGRSRGEQGCKWGSSDWGRSRGEQGWKGNAGGEGDDWPSWEEVKGQAVAAHDGATATPSTAGQGLANASTAVAGNATAASSASERSTLACTTVATSQIFDLDYFRAYGPFAGHWKQNNAALKWFRMICERDHVKDRMLASDEAEAVGKLLHDDVGTEYTFDETTMIPWKWQEMVAQMDGASMEHVVCGPEGRSGGLVACSFSARPNSYDHKRAHAMAAAGRQTEKKEIWDFVAHRADGSGIRLHPNWSNTKIETFDVLGHATAVAEPTEGCGKSSGPGTFRFYVNLGNQRTLRFNGQIRLGPNPVFPAPKPKAKARARPQ